MKVELPDGEPDGVSQVGIGISREADIQETDDGVRYVEVDDGPTARTLMRRWSQVHDANYADDGRLSGGSWPDGGESLSATVEDALDEHWQSVVTAVREGVYDDHLDELAEADDRESVQNAIDERRTEVM
jgi:hypothetical protein